MQIITTVYVTYLEKLDEANSDATIDTVKIDDLSGIIERKLMEEPDRDRELVSVHTGTSGH